MIEEKYARVSRSLYPGYMLLQTSALSPTSTCNLTRRPRSCFRTRPPALMHARPPSAAAAAAEQSERLPRLCGNHVYDTRACVCGLQSCRRAAQRSPGSPGAPRCTCAATRVWCPRCLSSDISYCTIVSSSSSPRNLLVSQEPLRGYAARPTAHSPPPRKGRHRDVRHRDKFKR